MSADNISYAPTYFDSEKWMLNMKFKFWMDSSK